MTERSAWLSRTLEDAIEPDLAICDAHHHLWEFPGDRYLVDEFLADVAGGHRVVTTVYVECHQNYRRDGPAELRPVGETEFIAASTASLQDTAAPTRVAAGIVGFADLTLGAAVQEVLEAHVAATDRFRGVRHASAWDPSSDIRPAHTNPPADLLLRREFRLGIARLTGLGLTFDAWLYHPQIPQLVDLACEFPGLTIVLDHAGGPLGIGPYAGRRESVLAQWRRDMSELATCGNVVVKLGGLAMTMSGFGWHKRARPPGSSELSAAMQPYVRTCVDVFGPSRCMFESNFPVERASCSYTVLWNAFKRLVREYAPAERSALLHGTATRVYRLEE